MRASRHPSVCFSRRRPTPEASRPASTWRLSRPGALGALFAVLIAGPANATEPFAFQSGPPLKLELIRSLAPRAARAAPAEPPAEILVQVDVNRQGLNETVVVLRSAGELHLAREDLERWRLRVPSGEPVLHAGQAYYPISALPGATFDLDERRQRLAVTARPEAFAETTASLLGQKRTDPVLPGTGGFLNYALSASRTEVDSTENGFFEAGLFSRHGVLTSGLLAPELGVASTWTRLDTTFTADFPDRLTSLRLGDSVTRAGAWGLPVRFGGVQYGTKFGVQPGFIPFPVATALGRAALPSTVDVFVNNALVTRREVPPGPFSIANIPVITGAGDVQVVVRDLLGREQVFTQAFYGSTALFREGVADYSFELGSLREDFGLSSNEYGQAIAVGTYRRGLTESLTGEVRAEAAETAKSAGASATFRAGLLGVANLSFAGSRSPQGTGRLLGAGFERTTRRLSFGVQTELQSEGFRQAGFLPGELAPKRRSFANIGVPLGAAGTVSLSHAEQQYHDREGVRVSTLSYSIPLGSFGQLGVSAIRTSGPTGGESLFATLAVPLGGAASASAGFETRRARTGERDSIATLAVQKSLPLGDGYGYRVQRRGENLYGSFALQGPVGTYEAEAAKAEFGGTATRLTARGGLGTAGGHVFASREITESFAVVRVADFEGVRVLHDNQVAARTDESGYAVLPRLRAYDRNPIDVQHLDLPFDARIGALRVEATPYFRSGVFIDLPVQRVRAATLRVALEDGSDLPSGAVGRVEGRAEEYPVALGGQAYLENLQQKSRVAFTWKGQRCEIELSLPAGAEPLPDLGTFVCKGVRP
jgi:outer membrane usher protein